jgi:hypothetical protein
LVPRCHLPSIPVVHPTLLSADAIVVSLSGRPPIDSGDSTSGQMPTRVNNRPVMSDARDGEQMLAAERYCTSLDLRSRDARPDPTVAGDVSEMMFAMECC